MIRQVLQLVILAGLASAADTPAQSRVQAKYPAADGKSCGAWKLVDNVCCPTYCTNDDVSETCTGNANCKCGSPPSEVCKSGTEWGETKSLDKEDWHFSRSTHFGLTSGGACGFGLYGLCTKGSKDKWVDAALGDTCTAFCTAYPQLCKDPPDTTLRGNFAAPNGNYYSQWWPSLPGDLDNYLSCGECFQLIRTKADGSDYAESDAGYTPPITLEIVDSCPCSANSKWCCGSGNDHCGEIKAPDYNFKHGCPIPKGSHHMDLSDIAMGRLQSKDGSLAAGVIPIRYKRVSCPKPGNVYLWLREGGGPYYFAFTVVNAAGIGAVVNVEVQGKDSKWTSLVRDPNYTESRPQERYGTWRLPQGDGPYAFPLSIRLTSAAGEQIVGKVTTFDPPATAPKGFNYYDLGVQFTK